MAERRAGREGVKERVVTATPEETEALGRRLSAGLEEGDVVGLVGELGAGKTCLVRGIAAGLGSAGYIKSPSYTLINVYEGGRLPLYHMDLYRLAGAAECDSIGIDEYIYSNGISVIEWVDNIPGLIDDCTVVISLKYLEDGDGRDIEIERFK